MPIRYIWCTAILTAVYTFIFTPLSSAKATAIIDIQEMSDQYSTRAISPRLPGLNGLKQRQRTTDTKQILPLAYPCSNFVVVQEIVHQIETMTDTLQQTQDLNYILVELRKAQQRYASSETEIDQRRVFLLDTIIAIVDPSHRTTRPHDLRCSWSATSTGSTTQQDSNSINTGPSLTAGRIQISGKLFVSDPMPPSGASCKDFPDKCTEIPLVIPIGVVATTTTPLFEAGQYLPIGCIDAATRRDKTALHQIEYQRLLYQGVESIDILPHTPSVAEWMQYIILLQNMEDSTSTSSNSNSSTPKPQSIIFTGYIRPQLLKDRQRLPCEGAFAAIVP